MPVNASTAKRGSRAAFPKGRQADPKAVDEVRSLVGHGDLPRDMLIEYLHAIQDRYGSISARHLAALAQAMRLSQTEVFEVATFYAHFDVLADGEEAPPPLTVKVCDSISCAMAGGTELLETLKTTLGSRIRVVRTPCVGACNKAPVAVAGQHQLVHATPDSVRKAIDDGDTDTILPPYQTLDTYRDAGGYRILDQVLHGTLRPDDILKIVDDAGLKGLGGAGFPSARKWRFLRDAPKPRLMAVNADEGEPGTFKDRYCLETEPHRVLEGALIAAHTIEAEAVYIYLRDEYPVFRTVLQTAITALNQAGLTETIKLHLRRGAGAYICGEETALLESLEGKRGLPRNRPPYPAENGLFGRPTLIHNVETLYWLPEILDHGATAFQTSGALRLYSVSGRVKNPGVVKAPAGTSVKRLIHDYCGGMQDGHTFKAYLPGGASGGILPADLCDLPLDFGSLDDYGCFVGSGAVVVLSDQDDMRAVVANLLAFFADESCGQCTPCRLGCEKLLALLENGPPDKPLIAELNQTMRDASICGLGQAAPNPVDSALRFFGDEFK